MQNVQACSRHLQRHGYDTRLPVASLSQNNKSLDIVVLERSSVAVRCMRRIGQGELIGSFRETWEFGRTERCTSPLRWCIEGCMA
jgi:hypothetical protein